jgi:hypothetical protein
MLPCRFERELATLDLGIAGWLRPAVSSSCRDSPHGSSRASASPAPRQTQGTTGIIEGCRGAPFSKEFPDHRSLTTGLCRPTGCTRQYLRMSDSGLRPVPLIPVASHVGRSRAPNWRREQSGRVSAGGPQAHAITRLLETRGGIEWRKARRMPRAGNGSPCSSAAATT